MRKQVEWLYRQANVNLEDYQTDLDNLRRGLMNNLDDFLDTHFIPVDPEDFKKYCPTITAKIAQWGLTERLAEIAIILVKPQAHYVIHRDFPLWKKRNIALNFPVLNCENSYTAFYDATIIDKTCEGALGDSVYVHHANQVDEPTAKEIGRCDSTVPHWINVYVPHAPVVEHDQTRISVSIRFHPELFDYIASGRFDQELARA